MGARCAVYGCGVLGGGDLGGVDGVVAFLRGGCPLAWFRFYDEVVDDHKVQQLTPSLFKTWVNCMCIAKQNGGILPPIETIAYKLRVTIARAEAFIEALRLEKLIDIRNDGGLEMHNWPKRQFGAMPIETVDASHKASGGKYVYVVGQKDSTVVKVGFSKNPWARLVELQTAAHEKLEILAVFRSNSTSEVDLHVLLSDFHKNGEWFDLSPEVAGIIHDAHSRKCSYEQLLDLLRSSRSSGRSSSTTTTEQNRAEHIQNRTEKKAKSAAIEDTRRIPLRDLIFSDYKQRRGVDLITDPSDWKAFEGLLRATKNAPGMTVDEIRSRWIRFLSSERPFHREQGHPLRWFCLNINAFSENGSTPKQKNGIDWDSPEMQEAERKHRKIYGDKLK